MKTTDADPTAYSALSEKTTAKAYLSDALEQQWTLDTEYLGSIPDLTKAWELQNEIRSQFKIKKLSKKDLEHATEHLQKTEED